MMRRNALAMGAAVLAAVPVVMCGNIAASAEYLPSWEQWRSLYDYNLTDPTVQYLYTDDVIAPYWRSYASAVMAIVEGVYINGSYEITPGNFSGYSGYYLYNGARRFGSVYGNTGTSTVHSDSGAPSEPISVWALQDGALSVTVAAVNGYSADFEIAKNLAPGTTGQPSYALSFHRIGSPLFATISGVGTGICDSFSQSVGKVQWHTWRIPLGGAASEFTQSSDYIGGTGAPLLGETASFGSLPTAEGFETITADNALDYISDVLNPYMVENAPKTEPYLFDPYATDPEEPIYPSDFAEGIPKAWTVENPRLPSYSLDLQLPTADFEAVDVSAPLEHHAAGLRFWWALLGECLDHFGVKELVVFALAIGLIVTILTRLGR